MIVPAMTAVHDEKRPTTRLIRWAGLFGREFVFVTSLGQYRQPET